MSLYLSLVRINKLPRALKSDESGADLLVVQTGILLCLWSWFTWHRLLTWIHSRLVGKSTKSSNPLYKSWGFTLVGLTTQGAAILTIPLFGAFSYGVLLLVGFFPLFAGWLLFLSRPDPLPPSKKRVSPGSTGQTLQGQAVTHYLKADALIIQSVFFILLISKISMPVAPLFSDWHNGQV